MKLRKRMIAVILVAISILNSMPTVYEATGIDVSVADDLDAYLPDKLEYGTKLYQFDKSVLTNIMEEDEVYLVAEVNTNSANAGETVEVTFTNFQLVGEQAENYILQEVTEITLDVTITKRIIKIAPSITSIYYGQEKPEIIDELADYSGQLVDGDEVAISAKFAIVAGTDVGTYDISIVEGSLECSNENYEVVPDENVKFEVLEDDIAPIVENASFESNNVGIIGSVTIKDMESGIAKIEYGWDSKDYIDYVVGFEGIINECSPNFQLIFRDDNVIEGNQHTLYVKVTDNAGNVQETSFKDPIGSDRTPPSIRSIEIKSVEGNIENAIINFLKYGIFSNNAVEIIVDADDISENDVYESGLEKATITYDENGNDVDVDMTLNNAGKYVHRVSADKEIKNMQIIVTDKIGWSTKKSLTEVLNDDSVRFDNLYVEDDAPMVAWTFGSEGHTDLEGNIWYGIEENSQEITINVHDNEGEVKSGLNSITITDNNEILVNVDFEELVMEKGFEFPMDRFTDGKHTIAVSAVDNAGNQMSIQEKTFYIDRTEPELDPISIERPEGKEIEEKLWFDGEDVIVFRIDASDSLSGLKSITVNIKGEQSVSKEFSFANNTISSDENGYYVKVDTTGINSDEFHKYEITGQIIDFAGNTSQITPLVVYKDLESPSIGNFTIEKKSTLIEKILNILTFGIYTNDTFIVKVGVSEPLYDSGLARVELRYDGISEAIKMEKGEDGRFFCVIPGGSKILYENISVTATDKFGKKTTKALTIDGAAGVDDVLVDQIAPEVSLEIPASDMVSQSGMQKWYSTNKEITFTVQDLDSGIRDVSFKVNKQEITNDKNNVPMPKVAITENAASNDVAKHTYIFDTDYITAVVGASEDGKYSIELAVTDNAGNVSVKTAEYFVDKGNPHIDRVEFTPVTVDGITNTTEFVQLLEYGFFFKSDTVLTVYISDATPSAGLDKITYRLVYWEDGVQLGEFIGNQKISNGKAEIVIPKDFKGQVYIEAYDNVNNRSGEKTTKAYVVDNTEPTIQITQNVQTSYHDAVGNPLYVEDNSFTVEITDEISGIHEIGYAQSAEKNAYDRKAFVIENTGYPVGTILEDGWVVAAVDNNLVTKVVKTFSFNSDDNNVSVTFDATDNALNASENVKSATFTIDKTNPIINVSFGEDEDSDLYYDENRVAYITVIDRNITTDLVNVLIENTFGVVPTYAFTQSSITEYTAIVEFSEGDYTFSVNGTDLGGHTAHINYSGGNEKVFFVDKTEPQVEENFSSFSDSVTEDSFNLDKTVEIKITEHNFAPALVNLQVLQKEAGADHTSEGFVDITEDMLRNVEWNTSGDVHTISFTIDSDGVYQLEMTPMDLAGNTANQRQTVVFEIDKTVPTIVSRNGMTVSPDDTGYLDVYDYYRQDEAAPTIEFDDANIDHIKYVLTVYVSKQTDDSGTTIITPVRVYLEEDSAKTGIVMGNKFTLPDFVRDGVYALELVAVDKAGNESEVNVNTYVRLVNQDVLAYIMDSNIEAKTGLYSFQYENGTAISKRPDNFEDIEIFVLAKNESDVDIVLRDNNGTSYNTDAKAVADGSIYGMQMYRFTLESEYFKENFQSDTDIELCLSVINDGSRIDLGRMHIDNIAPTCDISAGFDSWKWYCSEKAQTITISNISELLDVSLCKVYDNGKEVAFEYLEENNTITFTLEKGWHNVGIVLSDMAGNTYNIQEKANIHIGYFWLWVIMGTSVVFVGIAVYVLLLIKKRKQMEAF